MSNKVLAVIAEVKEATAVCKAAQADLERATEAVNDASIAYAEARSALSVAERKLRGAIYEETQ